MEILSYLLTGWIKTSEAVYRVYPISNDYGGFDIKWQQVYPIPKGDLYGTRTSQTNIQESNGPD